MIQDVKHDQGGSYILLAYILGVLSGTALPVQTSVNSKLREKIGSPLLASLVSFAGGLVCILIILLVTGSGLSVDLGALAKEPLWVWTGGLCGVVLVICNILILPRIGSAEAVIMFVFGQVLFGLMIENFGWFGSEVYPFTVSRAIGAALVILGVCATSYKDGGSPDVHGRSGLVWLWRALGATAGIASALQVAINSHVSSVVGSPFKSAFVSFIGGVSVILLINIVAAVAYARKGMRMTADASRDIPNRWWMWTGGVFGCTCVVANVLLADALGTGMTVIVTLIGQIGGGVVIDKVGFLGAERRDITGLKILGMIAMVAGAAVIRLI